MAWLTTTARGIGGVGSSRLNGSETNAVARPFASRGSWAKIASAAIIALVAVALRCWHLDWGLATDARHLAFPDEPISWGPYVHDFIPLRWASFDRESLNYPPFYGYVVGLTAWTLNALGWLATPPAAPPMFWVPPSAVLLARAVSVAASLVTIALVGLAAGRMYSARTGWLAAALMAVVPFEVVYVHVASPDILLATGTLLTTFLAYRLALHGGGGTAFAAGIAAGMTTGTKYTGLAIVVAIAWAVGERLKVERAWRRAAMLAALAATGFALAGVIACPPCVLHSDRLAFALQNHLQINWKLFDHFHNNYLVPSLGWYGRPYAYQLVASLPFTLGWPLYAAALLGIGIAIRRHTLADRILLLAFIPYFLVMARSMLTFPRFLLPLLPILVILAARGFDVWAPQRLRPVLLASVWIYSLALGATQVARFSLDQQRDVAQWIAKAPPRTAYTGQVRVGVPKMILDYFRLAKPFKAANLKPVELDDGAWFTPVSPEYFVLPDWYAIAIERDIPDSPAARDLARLRSGEAGYDRVAEWRSSYLQQRLYTSLDPAFAGDLWQGEIGFTVYARRATRG